MQISRAFPNIFSDFEIRKISKIVESEAFLVNSNLCFHTVIILFNCK